MRRIALLSDPSLLGHDTGGGHHPEVPSRLTVIGEHLVEVAGAEGVRHVPLERARWPWLRAAHEESYLLRFEDAALSGRSWFDHGDNRLSYDTYEAALTAAAAGPAGIDIIEKGDGGELTFCLVRPPGHHAEAARAMGFCFINNTVVAARYWQEAYERKRILIVDWDAHHGNGIQKAFASDPGVFYASIHEHPTFSFPGTGYAEERGSGDGEGTTLNVPLQPGAGDDAVCRAIDEQIEDAVERFAPEALIIAAGFDGHREDDMSGLTCTTGLYRRLGDAGLKWSQRYCGGRVLSILEGGYHLPVLGESTASYLSGLGDFTW